MYLIRQKSGGVIPKAPPLSLGVAGNGTSRARPLSARPLSADLTSSAWLEEEEIVEAEEVALIAAEDAFPWCQLAVGVGVLALLGVFAR